MRLLHRIEGLKNVFTKSEVEQNVKLSPLQSKERILGVTRHIFKEFKRSSEQYGVQLLLVIDTPRQYIYHHKNPRQAKVYRFNEISLELANEMEIEMIDLTDSFVQDYKRNQQRFEFKTDGHWNSRGHRVVGQTLSKFLLDQVIIGTFVDSFHR